MAALELVNVRKDYQGLRPLRLRSLAVQPGERVALAGLEAAAAEALVDLLSAATLPDEGEVRVFGRPTTDIASPDAWLESLDSFGLVTRRAVFMEALTVRQNLALPFGLEIDPLSEDLAALADRMADQLDLEPDLRSGTMGHADESVRARVRLGRALAANPRILVLSHPTLDLPRGAAGSLGDLVARAADMRDLTVLALTDDDVFAGRVARRRLVLRPGTGAVTPARRSWWS